MNRKFPKAGNTQIAAKADATRLLRLVWAPYKGDATLKLKPSRSGSELKFGLHRVGRVLAPHAEAALTRFHQWQARPAFDADFASPPYKPKEKAAAAGRLFSLEPSTVSAGPTLIVEYLANLRTSLRTTLRDLGWIKPSRRRIKPRP